MKAYVYASVLAIWLLSILASSVAFGQEALTYIGIGPRSGAAVVQLPGGQIQEVRLGDNLPGWGQVVDVEEQELRLKQDLSVDEIRSLEERGQAYHDSRIVIIHRDPRVLLPGSDGER